MRRTPCADQALKRQMQNGSISCAAARFAARGVNLLRVASISNFHASSRVDAIDLLVLGTSRMGWNADTVWMPAPSQRARPARGKPAAT